MCVGEEQPAVRMDSGLIDLNDFGLNLATRDRVQFRKATTCGIVSLDNRTTVVKASEYQRLSRPAFPNEEFMLLFLGDILYSELQRNATFGISLTQANVSSYLETKYVLCYIYFPITYKNS